MSPRRLFERALVRLADIGAEPATTRRRGCRKALLVLIAILILPISGIWAVLYLAFGAWTGYVAVLYAVVSIGSIAHLRPDQGLRDTAQHPAAGHLPGTDAVDDPDRWLSPDRRRGPVGPHGPAGGARLPRNAVGRPVVRVLARGVSRVGGRRGRPADAVADARVVLQPDARAEHHGRRDDRVHAAGAVRAAARGCPRGALGGAPARREPAAQHPAGLDRRAAEEQLGDASPTSSAPRRSCSPTSSTSRHDRRA